MKRHLQAYFEDLRHRFVAYGANVERRNRSGEFGKWPWQKEYGLWPWQRKRKGE